MQAVNSWLNDKVGFRVSFKTAPVFERPRRVLTLASVLKRAVVARAQQGLKVDFDQGAGGVLVGVQTAAAFDAVFVFPVAVFKADIQLLFAQVEGFAQVILDLRVEVQVGVIRTA